MPGGKGGVHDIGKNVGIIKLEKLGYKVADLGRNVPVDSVEELEQWTWYIKPFYTQTDDTAPLNLKKVFRVVIPVQAGNERRRYSFQFMVTDVVPYRGLSLG